jgi:hypothetical protein
MASADAGRDRGDHTRLRWVEFDLKTCPEPLRPPGWSSGGCHVSGRLIMKSKEELYVFAVEGVDAHINFKKVYSFKSDEFSTFQNVNP